MFNVESGNEFLHSSHEELMNNRIIACVFQVPEDISITLILK